MEAESILSQQPDSSFLVRDSESVSTGYSLSLRYVCVALLGVLANSISMLTVRLIWIVVDPEEECVGRRGGSSL